MTGFNSSSPAEPPTALESGYDEQRWERGVFFRVAAPQAGKNLVNFWIQFSLLL